MPLSLNYAVEVVLGFILLRQWLRRTRGARYGTLHISTASDAPGACHASLASAVL